MDKLTKKEFPKDLVTYLDLNTEENFQRVNCKLCQTPFRVEAESLFEKSQNFTKVVAFLEEKGEKHTLQAVRNHLINHYRRALRAIQLKEYGDDLKKWVDYQNDKKKNLKERSAMLQKAAAEIMSNEENSNLDELRKSASVAKGLLDSATSAESAMKELDGDIDRAEMLAQAVRDTIYKRIKDTSNDITKKELMGLIDDLAKVMKDIFDK
jgi:hypothetical protein